MWKNATFCHYNCNMALWVLKLWYVLINTSGVGYDGWSGEIYSPAWAWLLLEWKIVIVKKYYDRQKLWDFSIRLLLYVNWVSSSRKAGAANLLSKYQFTISFIWVTNNIQLSEKSHPITSRCPMSHAQLSHANCILYYVSVNQMYRGPIPIHAHNIPLHFS